jgi:spore germination cell wall hydrolase CwlJ-like protein
MVLSRTRSKGVEFAPFGLAAFLFLAGSTGIGYQDLGALIAQQPSVSARAREHLIASPFGTIHAATFSLPRPVGTFIPESDTVILARFTPADPENTASISGDIGLFRQPEIIAFPSVNRALKGDRLIPGHQIEPASQPVAPETPRPGPGVENDTDEFEVSARTPAETDPALALEMRRQVPADTDASDEEANADEMPAAVREMAGIFGASRVYFGAGSLGETLATIQPWAAGEEPVVMLPRATADLDLKPAFPPIEERTKAEMKAEIKEGVTVAGKGQVTGEGQRPKTPAEMLGLVGKARAKAEKCLANAVYFEARSEPVRGQIAVSQVVINRAFSGYYPEDICGVVYQNAHRHLSCQFTFACDGIPDVVTERDEWERAKRIARESLDGKLWLRDVGKATHYHASYVYPYWVRSMHRLTKIGLHRFYRPRKWGDGSDEPNWSTPAAMANAADKF